MTATQTFSCLQRSRVTLAKNSNGEWNGIDYLELAGPLTLHVFFVDIIEPKGNWSNNVRIEGGVRFRTAPRVVSATADGSQLTVELKGETDASTYTLRLVSSALADDPPPGIDPLLASVPFSFRAHCPSDFDCAPVPDCTEDEDEPVEIDYLAKDYNSFRQLMLDRLALLMPQGMEKSPADIQVAMVEVLAYAADYLSYAQDAAATEAYLGTSRLRTSLRRHARHLDYPVDDGQNARAWIHLNVSVSGLVVKKGTALVTKHDALTVLDDTAFAEAKSDARLVFETMHDATLYEQLNEIELYTWGDRDCCLKKGSTSASLFNDGGGLTRLDKRSLLLFEEVRSPLTDEPADADKEHRHIVRLTKVEHTTDKLNGDVAVTMVEWAQDDAMPFSLLLESDKGNETVVARGNLVLVDYGKSVKGEVLDDPASDGRVRLVEGPVAQAARAVGRTGLTIRDKEDNKPLRYDPSGPATGALDPPSGVAVPEIELVEDGGEIWLPQADLLRTGAMTREFVVEPETGGETWLRFGDDTFGKERPKKWTTLASYRVGNGTVGNVGAGAIAHINGPYSIAEVRNPLAAKGGRDPESAESIRTYAPLAFQTQQRAVTEDDYTTVLGRHPDVQRAKALRRWTGSWYTMVVLVDRKGGLPMDEEFRTELTAYLERFRMAALDVEIVNPVYVPLDIAMTVCIKPDAIRSDVQQALLKAFSTSAGSFFDPDAWTFNSNVALSAVIARAMLVTGVASVDFSEGGKNENRFQRYGRSAADEIDEGVIAIGDTAVARLDNSALFPEYGRIEFYMEGGR